MQIRNPNLSSVEAYDVGLAPGVLLAYTFYNSPTNNPLFKVSKLSNNLFNSERFPYVYHLIGKYQALYPIMKTMADFLF